MEEEEEQVNDLIRKISGLRRKVKRKSTVSSCRWAEFPQFSRGGGGRVNIILLGKDQGFQQPVRNF